MLQVFLLPLTADHSTINTGAFPFNLIPRLSALRHGNEFGWRLIWEVHTGGKGLGGTMSVLFSHAWEKKWWKCKEGERCGLVKSEVHSYIDRMQHHSSRLTIRHSWDSTVYHSTPLTVNNKYHDVFGHWVHSLPQILRWLSRSTGLHACITVVCCDRNTSYC